MSSVAYRINTPKAGREIIDGEAVIVHLGTGVYYSVDQSGAAIWSLIEQGTPVAAILDALQIHYAAPPAEIEAGLRDFIAQLLAEGLVLPLDAPQATADAASLAGGATGDVWRAPALGRYTDMEDLLLLDPIHEADDTGWPNAKGT